MNENAMNNPNQTLIPYEKKPLTIDIKSLPNVVLWLADVLSPRTRSIYKKSFLTFTSYFDIQNESELHEIEYNHAITFKALLQKEGYQKRTINTYISAISSYFNFIKTHKKIKENPFDNIKREKIPRYRVETLALSVDEVKKMLAIVKKTKDLKGLRDTAIIYTFFFTGCRVSELCGLKVKDYFLNQGFQHLKFIIKGGDPNPVAINPRCSAVIENYLNEAGHINTPESPLFLPLRNNINAKNINRPLSRNYIFELWGKYAKMINISGTSPHSARATFITQALKNNWNIQDVQKTVGHKKIDTTISYNCAKPEPEKSASLGVTY